jgi:nucleoside-diphosphate-sugar epimerase
MVAVTDIIAMLKSVTDISRQQRRCVVSYFITGASGWIGRAVVRELLNSGAEVTGLARSEDSAEKIAAAGATPIRGSLDDPEGIARAAAASDGVIHLAFDHEAAFLRGAFAETAQADRRAVEAIGGALSGTGRPFIVASGVAGLASSTPATESDGLLLPPALHGSPMAIRHATSLLALSFAGVGVRSIIVRFAPTVHGTGDGGFIHSLMQSARQAGESNYVNAGETRWSAVHVTDAAAAVRRSLESAPAGAVIHAVGEEGVPFKSIATSIGQQLGVPVRSVDPETALSRLGFLGMLAGQNLSASSTITRQLIDWMPAGPTLLEDIDGGGYAL